MIRSQKNVVASTPLGADELWGSHMLLEGWGQSDVGRVRTENKDRIAVDPDAGLFLVTDGISSTKGGGLAADMATQIIGRHMRTLHDTLQNSNLEDRNIRTQMLDTLSAAFNDASEAIYSRRIADTSISGMATTAVVLQVVGNVGLVGHVGDSRLYMLRDGTIYRVTEDHTLGNDLVQKGALSAKDVETFAHRKVLSRSLGKAPTVEVDALVIDLLPGDRFVLCSDGLTDHVRANEIDQIVKSNDLKHVVGQLISTTNDRGGSDNVSVIVVGVQGSQPASTTMRTEMKAALLRDVVLFKDLTFQEVMRVVSVVHETRFSPGQTIIREGETGTELYILVDGDVSVHRNGVFISKIRQGEHFGDLALIGNGIRSATVSANNATRILTLSKKDFYELVRTDHGMALKLLWRFLQNLGGRVNNLTEELAQLRSMMGEVVM